jgi:phosphoribosylformylglycinamidine cyclo-ligase
MYRTFNCGAGMVLVVDPADESDCLQRLAELGEKAWVMGEVTARENEQAIIFV